MTWETPMLVFVEVYIYIYLYMPHDVSQEDCHHFGVGPWCRTNETKLPRYDHSGTGCINLLPGAFH